MEFQLRHPMRPHHHQPPQRQSSLMLLKKHLLGTAAGTLLLLAVLLPSPTMANGQLGVIRSQENLNQWNQIETRLRSSGIGYQAIDLLQLKSAADLNGIRVLFLPNIETFTETQVAAIDGWVKQGGQLVASGPVGRNSSAKVRQQLRSLLGGYWAFALSQPTALEAKVRCQNVNCSVTTNWVPPATQSQVRGGVLIPANLNSQTAATWAASAGSPAVISTQQAVYLGWIWGDGATADLDTNWLKAALNRPQTSPPVAATPPQTPVPPIVVHPSTPHSNPLPSPTNSVSPVVVMPPRPHPQPEIRQPQVSRNTTPPPSLPPQIFTPNPQPPVFNNPPVPETFTDPSDQSAPAGLEVKPGNDAISTTEANAMRQELVNLLGRFESALVAANSGNVPVNLSAAAPSLVASSTNEAAFTVASGPRHTNALQAITRAKDILKDFPELVSQQQYATARQRWLEARQLLWQHYPTDGQRSGAEVRAVWLDRGTIVRAQSAQGLAAIFDQLAAAGINTVFFETINAGYPIYPSQVAPQQNPLTVGWDPLAAAVKLAHERGMELHAWMWTFAVGNQRHNALLGQPDTFLGPVITAHPDWVNLDNQGRNRHIRDTKVYLDPANREARSYLLRLISEIASQYKVDGIQLDYIRYPFQDQGVNFTYGYGKAAREQFQQIAGVDPQKITPSDPRWPQWIAFKTQQINSFVAEVSQLLRQNYPRVILSAAVFPHPEQERIRKIQQDWEVWTRRGDIDLIVPMTYALDTNRLQRITEPLTDPGNLGSAIILPSVKVHSLPEIVAIDQIQALRDLPTGGYSIFAVESIGNGLQSFFRRTQSQNNTQVLPYRQPFAAAAMRYTALKQEWSYLLANNQLWMREPDLAALRTQAQNLGEALNQLAANPSQRNLMTAKQLLAAFQSQFKNAMRLQVLEQGYQVQAWDNRLESLEMLLRYGERVQFSRRS